ncbi:beta-galactosidase domain-containing protein [Pochonia chlamydosporia 170]|uniref:Beta-galactosidase domain-containing protein n=1 Tax=Pochonia chlamydosporia 170 TaxID=1380566 RepID=A0A179G8H3_METCM|nr:beta-galactosidase domain-containing protein [Pochonia chlamydosporia 170]OAQ74106.1 beta-galactosidase domain-containing protein [Pochonia chlamydosporia 170]
MAAPAACNNASSLQHWLYSSQIDDQALKLLENPELVGVQALYSWKSLEPSQNEYDFSNIKNDMARVSAKGKKFWIQLQDRTFSPTNDPVPKYMHTPQYNNGSAPTCDGETCDTDFKIDGWMAQQWNPEVRKRYQALLSALSKEFDGQITGLNLPETSIEVNEKENNFTNEAYFRGELENAGHAVSVFKKSYVVQYVNFWPDGWNNANNRFTDSFDYYAEHGVGVGGPDLIPYKEGQVKNSYPFITKYHDKVPITVVAVQEPDLKAINPVTNTNFTKAEFVDYATNVLKVRIIFWATSSPWLQSS